MTSTVIGTSAVIGALAFSTGGAMARTDGLGVSQQQAFKEAGDGSCRGCGSCPGDDGNPSRPSE
jgi:hypothetical protein